MNQARAILKVSIFLVILFPTFAFTSQIILKTGQKIEGNIIEQTDKYVKIDTGLGVPITYYSDQIGTVNSPSSSVPSITINQDKSQQDDWIEKLKSPKQDQRDAAAAKLRGAFTPSDKDDWQSRLSWLQPGMPLNDVEKKLGIATGKKAKAIGSRCAGVSCSTMYKLDSFCNVIITYDDHQIENKVISFKIDFENGNNWIAPPSNFTGVWRTYYVNGQKHYEADYKNGINNGRFIIFGAMLFLVEIPGSPKIFSLQDHLYAMILSSIDQ